MSARPQLERRAFSGSVANVANILAILVQNLALVPVLLHHWSAETYGTWITLFAVQSLLFTINYGQEAFVGYELARVLHEDPPALPPLIGNGIALGIVICILEVLLILGIGFAHGASVLGLGGGAATSVTVCEILAVVVGSWIGFGSSANILIRVGYALGYYSKFTFYSVLFRVLVTIAVCISAAMGFGLWGAALAYGITTAVTQACLAGIALRLLRQHQIGIGRPSFAECFSILKKSTVVSGTSLLDAFSNNGLLTIISSVLSPAAVPSFSTVRTITNTANQGVAVIMHPLDPDMIRYRAKNEFAKLFEVFSVCWAVAGSAINFGLCILPLFIEPLYRAWTRGKLSFNLPLFALLALGVTFRTFGHPALAFLQATNALDEQGKISGTRAALVITLSLVLIHPLGLFGVALALAISEFVGGAALPIVYAVRSCAGNDTGFPFRNMAWAGTSVVVVGIAFACYCHLPGAKGVIAASSGAAIILLGCRQLTMLHGETRRRMSFLLAPRRGEAF